MELADQSMSGSLRIPPLKETNPPQLSTRNSFVPPDRKRQKSFYESADAGGAAFFQRPNQTYACLAAQTGFFTRADALDVDAYLSDLERRRRVPPNHLTGFEVDLRMRQVLLDWVMQVSAQFDLATDTLHLATLVIDHASHRLAPTKSNYQLLGLTCLFVAIKYEEPLVPHVQDISYVGGSKCAVSKLLDMEAKVLKAVGFYLNFAYPSHFLRKLLFLAEDLNPAVQALARAFLDCAILAPACAGWLPSEQALAAFHLACHLSQVTFQDRFLETANMTASDLDQKTAILAKFVCQVKSRKLSGIKHRHDATAYKKMIESVPYLDALVMNAMRRGLLRESSRMKLMTSMNQSDAK